MKARRFNRQSRITEARLRDHAAMTEKILASDEYDVGTTRGQASAIAFEEICRRHYTCVNGEVSWHYPRAKKEATA